MKPSETSATRSWRKRRQNSCQRRARGDLAADVEELQPAARGRAESQRRRRSSFASLSAAGCMSRLRALFDAPNLLRSTARLTATPSRRDVRAARLAGSSAYSSRMNTLFDATIPAERLAEIARAAIAAVRGDAPARAAGGARAPAQPRGVRRPGAPARRGLGAAHGDRAGAAALDGPLRAAGLGQDDARADRRRALAGGLRGAQRGAGRARRGARGDRARRATARRARRHARRSSSSTRSTASTRPSRTRCCRPSRTGWSR